MSHVVLSPVAALLLGALAPDQAQAAAPPTQDIRAMVREAAFDPRTYFPSRYVKDLSIVRIAYTGDDYGWPVYSIAIAAGWRKRGMSIPRVKRSSSNQRRKSARRNPSRRIACDRWEGRMLCR